MPPCHQGQQHSSTEDETNTALSNAKKRSLSYTFTTPISAPRPLPLLLGPGACHQPFPVSLHSVTDPSLYSPYNASPPLVRSADVLAQPCAPPLVSRLKAVLLFSTLTHTLTLCLLVPSPPGRHTHTHTHIQGPFYATTLDGGCHSHNRLDISLYNHLSLLMNHSFMKELKNKIIKMLYYS